MNPDAVIRGSRIWDGDWRKERAGATASIRARSSRSFYRKRSMLKRDVLPEDIAEAVYFLGVAIVGKVDGQHHQRGRGQRAGVRASSRGRPGGGTRDGVAGEPCCRREKWSPICLCQTT